MRNESVISVDPNIQGGTPCFRGTRVPVRSLFDALQHGRSLDYFVEQFSTVSMEQVLTLLDEAAKIIDQSAITSNAA